MTEDKLIYKVIVEEEKGDGDYFYNENYLEYPYADSLEEAKDLCKKILAILDEEKIEDEDEPEVTHTKRPIVLEYVFNDGAGELKEEFDPATEEFTFHTVGKGEYKNEYNDVRWDYDAETGELVQVF